MSGSLAKFGVLVRRNIISIVFPVGVTWAIFTDLERTRKYKAKKAEVASKAGEQLPHA